MPLVDAAASVQQCTSKLPARGTGASETQSPLVALLLQSAEAHTRSVEVGSLQWLLAETEVDCAAPPACMEAAPGGGRPQAPPTPPSAHELDRLVRQELEGCLSERVSLKKRMEVVHSSSKPDEDGHCLREVPDARSAAREAAGDALRSELELERLEAERLEAKLEDLAADGLTVAKAPEAWLRPNGRGHMPEACSSELALDRLEARLHQHLAEGGAAETFGERVCPSAKVEATLDGSEVRDVEDEPCMVMLRALLAVPLVRAVNGFSTLSQRLSVCCAAGPRKACDVERVRISEEAPTAVWDVASQTCEPIMPLAARSADIEDRDIAQCPALKELMLAQGATLREQASACCHVASVGHQAESTAVCGSCSSERQTPPPATIQPQVPMSAGTGSSPAASTTAGAPPAASRTPVSEPAASEELQYGASHEHPKDPTRPKKSGVPLTVASNLKSSSVASSILGPAVRKQQAKDRSRKKEGDAGAIA
mmetsp:Transcript_35978/g.99136  ORF Transcript_35978/g.99136 Transcript_35978/m.99136 type:complete len:484 (-) Transcript_35978:107-1558(-)